MKIRTVLFAGAVLPFALSYPAAALDAGRAPAGLILAQAEEECPEGQECPPAAEQTDRERRQERRKARQERRQQQQQQEQQQEQAEQPAEEPVEEQRAEEPVEEQPAAEDDEEQRAQDRAQRREERRQRREERRQQAEQPAEETEPAEEAEAADEDEPEAAEGDQEQRVIDRAQRRQERLRRQQERQQQAEEEPERDAEEETAEGGEEAGDTTVEEQLEAQGDEAEADQVRRLRRQAREEFRSRQEDEEVVDEDAGEAETDQARQERRDRRRDRDRNDWWERQEGNVVERRGNRIIIDLGGGNIIVRPTVPDDVDRLLFGARDVEVEHLRGGRTRTTVYRENGSQIITVRDRYGNIIRRIRRTPDGREIVLIDNRYDRQPSIIFTLPPPVIGIPQSQYIVNLGAASPQDIRGALLAPPVQPIEQAYTLEQVTANEDLRAYVPRIDLDTITFEFGSSTIGMDQMDALFGLGEAMEEVLDENPDEVYLVEGHTDAVGSDYDNLILSDERAEAVAVALSQNFDIPPENLVTEGYGEQFLKVNTQEPERQNRRVTVRRITPLLSAEAQ